MIGYDICGDVLGTGLLFLFFTLHLIPRYRPAATTERIRTTTTACMMVDVGMSIGELGVFVDQCLDASVVGFLC